MNKNKRIITILIITIVLLSLMICYLLFKHNKLNVSDSNKEQEVKIKEETKCQSDSDVNCIYYEENGFKIEKQWITIHLQGMRLMAIKQNLNVTLMFVDMAMLIWTTLITN